MAKETFNANNYKSPRRFNEQVNTILLIMFLTVVLILSFKGCGTHFSDANRISTQDKSTLVTDSTTSDSLNNNH